MTAVEYMVVLRLQTLGFLRARREECFGLTLLRTLFAPRPHKETAARLAAFSTEAAALVLSAHSIEALLVLAESAGPAHLGWLAVCEALGAKTAPDSLSHIWHRALAETVL